MKIIEYKKLNKNLERILKRSGSVYEDIDKSVDSILGNVKVNGDKALLELTEKFDGVKLKSLLVTEKEFDEAYENVTKEFVMAIKIAIKNQRKFQQSLLKKKSEVVETMPGIKVWREWRPIEKIGLYVPGGRARYPSSIVMVGVPALIAGCKEIVVCTPPNKEGRVPASTLVAANEVGIKKIYKVGGAQAIGAMAYGTKTIPKVYKVFGAGNSYVTVAKTKVFGEVDIDMPAGPSEVLVIADDSANPEWIAADLISQCEHGVESAAVFVTNSKEFALKVKVEALSQAKELASSETILKSLENYGAAIIVKNWDEAIEITNEYAPEHLEIVTENYMELKDKIVNAGSVFLGQFATEPAGDYATGSNHVLPTNGYAKMFEGLSIDAFGKQVEFQELSEKGLRNIANTVRTLAYEEGLPAHANAIEVRFKSND